MRPEVPGKSQRTPTGGSHSFGSVQGVRARCGLVIVDRRSDPNERQRALLERLAAGEEYPAAWAPGDWRSAYALRDRGLLRISRGGGEALVEVTEDGRYYLRHGHRPEEPTSAEGDDQAASVGPAGRRRSSVPYAERPVARARQAKATEWVERPLAEGRVRVADDDKGAEWRKVIGCAKWHGLGPPGNVSRRSALGQVCGSCTSQRATTQLTEPEAGGRRSGDSGSHAADFSSSGRGRAQRRGGATRDASCASAPGTSALAGAGSRGGAARVRRTGKPGVLLAAGGRCEPGERAKAERQIRWQAAMKEAGKQAVMRYSSETRTSGSARRSPATTTRS